MDLCKPIARMNGMHSAVELEADFLSFATSVLTMMKEAAANGAIPSLEHRWYEFGPGSWHERLESRPAYRALVPDWTRLKSLSSTVTCARSHLDSGLLKRPQFFTSDGLEITDPTFDQLLPWLVGELVLPIELATSTVGSIEITRDGLAHSYALYVAHWQRKDDVTRVTTPLFNFTGPSSVVRIDDIQIAPLTYGDKSQLWRPHGFLDEFMSLSTFESATFAIRCDHAQPRGLPSDSSIRIGDIRRAIRSLRLHKSGYVYVIAMFEQSVAPIIMSSGASGISIGRARSAGQQYEFQEGDARPVTDLIALLKKCQSSNALRHLDTALRRFDLSYDRNFPEDRLVDLCIALESTLLCEIRDELKYRLRLRGAALLADERDPLFVDKVLAAVYDARSFIVHDGKQLSDLKRSNDGLQPVELPALAEDIVRAILKRLLQRVAAGESVKDISGSLDDQIVRGLKRV